MRLSELLHRINTSKITLEEIPEARKQLEEEIFQCDEVLQDEETQFHIRNEYRAIKSQCRNALQKLN